MTRPAPASRLENVIISPNASIGEALVRLDEAGTGALVLCSSDRKLVGLLTDGDIRRAILKSWMLDDPCRSISNLEPIVALHPVASAEALRLMNRHDINQLPVVDAAGILCDLILRPDLGAEIEFEATAQKRLESTVISPTTSISDAVALLDKAGTGALVLCENGRILSGLLTDGDIRRAILQGKSLDAPCITIASRKPVVATRPISKAEALRLMNLHDIHHLPVVDAEHRVLEFWLRKDLVTDVGQDLSAVIMAGGYGKRLLPLTESVPKPMLPVGDRPLLELTIEQLRRSGIHRCEPHHALSPGIYSEPFWRWRRFRGQFELFEGRSPLGTAGGLKQMTRPDGTIPGDQR